MDEINIKEEVYKCSKCGLCQSVCPVFLATKNEMYLPRGRYNVLNNFFNNNRELSRHFIKDLDICLNCNACKDFCPSSINSAKIFTVLKNKYSKIFIPFMFKYKLILLMHYIEKNFKKNKLYNVNINKKKIAVNKENADVVYFQGCFNKYINPSDKNASVNLLVESGYNVIKILDSCCGLPYLSDGLYKDFDKNSFRILKSIPQEVQYIVTSCDSCYNTLVPVFEGTKYKLVKINELIDCDYIAKDAVFYKPFSLENYKGILPLINKKGSCSLMENFFMLKHPKISKKLLESVFFKKEDVENKLIVTSCNLTKWGIVEGCEKKNIDVKIKTLSEYIYSKE